MFKGPNGDELILGVLTILWGGSKRVRFFLLGRLCSLEPSHYKWVFERPMAVERDGGNENLGRSSTSGFGTVDSTRLVSADRVEH